MFLKYLQNSQEKTGARVSFLMKLQAWGLRPATLSKKRLWHTCFPVNLGEFFRTSFYRTPLVTASDFYIQWYPLPLDRWPKVCDHKVSFSTKTNFMVNFEIFQVISPFVKNWLSFDTETPIHNNDKIKNKIPFFTICFFHLFQCSSLCCFLTYKILETELALRSCS